MTSIRKISGFPQDINSKKVVKSGKQDVEKLSNETTSTSPPKKSDSVSNKVDISKAGKALLNRDNEIRKYVRLLPDVDSISSKDLDIIRERAAKDFYSSPEVTNKIIDALIAEQVLSSPDKTDPNSGLNPEKLKEIQEKINQNQYGTESVLNKIVDGLLDSDEFSE